MVEAFQTDYAFDYYDMTSWVGLSFTTYLNDGQLQKLRRDPRVSMVTEVTTIQFSQASPPWYDSPYGIDFFNNPSLVTNFSSWNGTSEASSWGRAAVNGKTSYVAPANRTRVYVLDAGVGIHADLNVSQRVNPTCTGNCAVVGCYAHATHVAGIIGANDNGFGIRGVNAGANIVSVAVLPDINSSMNCIPTSFTHDVGDPEPHPLARTNHFTAALDWVVWDLYSNQRWKTGVVNISSNNPAFSFPTLRYKMKKLATGTLSWPGAYSGAVITQSAGNAKIDSCAVSYGDIYSGLASVNDGIMVVGAINAAGQAVKTAFSGSVGGVDAGSGSNFGACVDIWAPGERIWSTWAFWGSADQTGKLLYNSYGRLSGTSMAAPHVAGIAAWLIENEPWLTTPAQVETRIRQLAQPAWQNAHRQGKYCRDDATNICWDIIRARLP